MPRTRHKRLARRPQLVHQTLANYFLGQQKLVEVVAGGNFSHDLWGDDMVCRCSTIFEDASVQMYLIDYSLIVSASPCGILVYHAGINMQ